jgi:hypothetical protein
MSSTLKALAPTQTEPLFPVTQAAVLAIFVLITLTAVIKFRPLKRRCNSLRYRIMAHRVVSLLRNNRVALGANLRRPFRDNGSRQMHATIWRWAGMAPRSPQRGKVPTRPWSKNYGKMRK